ncbi:MAG TPA: hypothetical protein VJC12_00190 [Candidatus Paceibacterota bacterium]
MSKISPLNKHIGRQIQAHFVLEERICQAEILGIAWEMESGAKQIVFKTTPFWESFADSPWIETQDVYLALANLSNEEVDALLWKNPVTLTEREMILVFIDPDSPLWMREVSATAGTD